MWVLWFCVILGCMYVCSVCDIDVCVCVCIHGARVHQIFYYITLYLIPFRQGLLLNPEQTSVCVAWCMCQ